MNSSSGKVVACLLMIGMILVYIGFSSSDFSYLLAACCLACVAFCVISFFSFQQHSLLRNHWEKPSNIFLLSIIIVYFQWIIDIVIGYKMPEQILAYRWLNLSMIISTIGVLAFLVGYVSKEVIPVESGIEKQQKLSGDSFFILVLLQTLFFFLFIKYVNVYTLISGANYQDNVAWGDASIYFEYLLYAVSYAIIILRVLREDECKNVKQFLKGFPFFSLLIMAIYLALRFMSGDRGPVIDFVLAFFFAFVVKTKTQIKAWMLILALAAGSIVMSLVGMARSYDTNMSFSERMSEAASVFDKSGRWGNDEKTILKSTEELAGSYDSYMVMIRGVKENNDYGYGRYQFFGVVNSIPFVAGIVKNVFNVPLEKSSSSMYATYSYYGKGNVISGLGSNCIGDFYLDLGIIGVIFLMIFVGRMFKYIDYSILLSDHKYVSLFSLIFCLVYASRSVYIPRSTFAGDLRYVFMVFLILWVNHFINTLNSSK